MINNNKPKMWNTPLHFFSRKRIPKLLTVQLKTVEYTYMEVKWPVHLKLSYWLLFPILRSHTHCLVLIYRSSYPCYIHMENGLKIKCKFTQLVSLPKVSIMREKWRLEYLVTRLYVLLCIFTRFIFIFK